MPSKGTDPRRFRGVDDETWEEYKLACKALYGTDNRSDVIRQHVTDTIAEWKRRFGK